MGVKNVTSHPEMLEWQLRNVLSELAHVQLHSQDEDCPCNQTELEPGEWCLAKHLLTVSGLASETALMSPSDSEMWETLASEAMAHHKSAKVIHCKGGTWPDLPSWSRAWRKKIEPIYYHMCKIKSSHVKLKQEPTCSFSQEPKVLDPSLNVCKGQSLMFQKPEAQLADPLLATIAHELCTVGVCLASDKKPEVTKTQPNYNNLAEGQTIVNEAGERWSITKIEKEGVPARWAYTIKIDTEKMKLTRRVPLGEIERYYKIEQPLPVCTPKKAERLESCILKGKSRNIKAGCAPEGDGSKECPVPFAYCRTSIGCRVGGEKRYEAKVK